MYNRDYTLSSSFGSEGDIVTAKNSVWVVVIVIENYSFWYILLSGF